MKSELFKIVESNRFFKEGVDKFLPRSAKKFNELRDYISDIINNVKKNGDRALAEYSEKFEKVKLEDIGIRVSAENIKDAYELVDKELLKALKGAIKNIEKFHRAQIKEKWTIETIPGVKTGQIFRPIESVGIYIPNGKAVYVSTVLMSAIPAKIAGVKKIIICSPPGPYDFKGDKIIDVNPAIIVAANECGISEIYKIGSAWAIAAMTYGTESVPAMLKIVGPGNKYVNAAKMAVKDIVSIDTPAGPSDIAIITDEYSNTDYIAYDLLSQVEHDPDNVGVLISYSDSQIDETIKKIDKILKKAERRDIIKESLEKYGLIVKTENIEDSIRVANEIAPEHLQIMTKNPNKILSRIYNAGAVFLGENSPVPLGDYCAGTNHILPTEGNAKKFSGLNTLEFMKIMDTLECTNEGVKELEQILTPLAEFEGLFGHRDAVIRRLKK
ncbi:MAG: histidinol dehydrogenase [Promethearchaeota archaeon]